MFLTVHASLGTLIGQHINTAWLAFILGIISHYFLDLIPHGDSNIHGTQKFFALASLDAVCLGILVVFLFTQIPFEYPKNIAWAIVGAIIPDITWVLESMTRTKLFRPLPEFNRLMHKVIKFDFTLVQGMILQLIVFGLCLAGIMLPI